jgi:hypothetical protein
MRRCILSNNEIIPNFDGLSIPELDKKLEDSVLDHERAERLICFGLLEMDERKGHEKFGFGHLTDYAGARFDYSDRKTFYLLSLARKIKKYPQIQQALAEGKIGWSKAYRICRLAEAEDELLSLESAMSMTVRELDRRIRKGLDDVVTKLKLWLKEDQASVWENALEVCRRVSGANLSPEQCLEYMAAEFLATWAFEANKEEVMGSGEDSAEETEAPDDESSSESPEPDPESTETSFTEETVDEMSRELHRICPEKDLPSPTDVPQSKGWHAVLDRDGYQCTFPHCMVRARLHPHHIEFRSHFGKKRHLERDSPCNVTTLCIFHHRLLHSGVIGVKGKAPFDLEWKMPKLTETAMMRLERRRMVVERKEKKTAKKASDRVESEARNDSEETTDSFLHTVAEERDDQAAAHAPSDSGESTDSPLHTFAEAEEQEESHQIDDEVGTNSPESEEKEDFAPEPVPVGAAFG